MFKIGDYIVYGNSGVCQVEKIGPMDLPGVSTDRLYYTLNPIYINGSKVFTPVDNQKMVMRPVLTKEEAEALIKNVAKIENLWVPEERRREDTYKEALKTGDCVQLIRIIKTLYSRKQSRLIAGKKITACDEKYLHITEEHLYGELAISLGMEKGEIEDYITSRVETMG